MAPRLEDLLRDRLGFPGFRPGQAEIVEYVVTEGDALVVMPTGAGKSLCYQLPALALASQGVAVVVSPLIALMKDQVEGLEAKGVRATLINSTLAPEQRRARMAEVAAGRWELLFVAPERFTPRFLEELRAARIGLFAIDEAHCLSQWGHDFRPDYLRLGEVRAALGCPRTVALTATATPEVQADILRVLGIPTARTFVTGFDRPNLRLEVIDVKNTADKNTRLAELVHPGPTLVYCATRKNVEQATRALQEAGVPCLAYHGGLDMEARNAAQDAFMSGDVRIVVATNAFGMGVDKANVRTIVHYDIPGTVEAYYQEIGRAGRDGQRSRVILLFREQDRRIQEFFIHLAHPPAAWVRMVWEELVGRQENPVYVSLEELARAIPDDATAERSVGSCLYVLQREGYVRRIAPTERAGLVRFTAASPEVTGLRATVYRWLREHQRGADPVGVWPDRLADELELSRDQVTAALRGLEERGVLMYDAPERTGGIELLRPDDALTLDEAAMNARRSRELQKLDRMMGYAESSCRRRYILEYFGTRPPWERCGDCDACRDGRKMSAGPRELAPDEEIVVRKVLSCVARLETPHSPKVVAQVLVGSQDRAVESPRFRRLSTYGLLSSFTQGEVEAVIRELVRAEALESGLVARTVGGRPGTTVQTVGLTARGRAVMAAKAPDFRMCFPVGKAAVKARPAVSVAAPVGVQRDLLAHLRDVRARLAKAEDVPAYVVAANRTLEEMARTRPMTRASMLAVHGMGPERFRKYGAPFLDAMRSWSGA